MSQECEAVKIKMSTQMWKKRVTVLRTLRRLSWTSALAPFVRCSQHGVLYNRCYYIGVHVHRRRVINIGGRRLLRYHITSIIRPPFFVLSSSRLAIAWCSLLRTAIINVIDNPIRLCRVLHYYPTTSQRHCQSAAKLRFSKQIVSL